MSDTIAAIATGMGNSGIGIIRISGEDAIAIANQIFIAKNKSKQIATMESYTAAFGLISYDGEIYDESIALVMRAPHTYTAEDVVELLEELGTVSDEVREKIMTEKSLETLGNWLKLAAKAESMEEFLKEM